MAEKNEVMEKLISLAKRRGFIYQGSEVYGGLAGTWDFGPMGVLLKENIKSLWLKMFRDQMEDMHGLDAAIVMNPKVWEASGHAKEFSDPSVDCLSCQNRFRVDQLLDGKFKEYAGYIKPIAETIRKNIGEIKSDINDAQEIADYLKSGIKNEKLEKKIDEITANRGRDIAVQEILATELKKAANFTGIFAQSFLDHAIECPECSSMEWDVPRRFSMMFETKAGVGVDATSTYLRPETAQGIFVNFKNVIDSMHPKLPFGIAQIGKAFRNEISPRDFIFRSREFEQMEVEYFVKPEDWEQYFEKWRQVMHNWIRAVGIDPEKVHELEVGDADRAHYSRRTIDFEFDFPFGRKELYGLAYRTDFDLRNHSTASTVPLEYLDEETSEKIIPHVIEPSLGVERTLLAVLASAYAEDEQNGEVRTYLKLPKAVAPIKAAVFPLLKNKPELVAKAKEVRAMLQKEVGPWIAWDDNGNIGKRYRRQDEIGTPVCVTIDFDTLGENPDLLDTVTIRDRDTGEQRRVKIADLAAEVKA